MGTSLLYVIHLRLTAASTLFLIILYFLPMDLRTCYGSPAFNVFRIINIDVVTAIEQPLMLVFYTS